MKNPTVETAGVLHLCSWNHLDRLPK